MKTNLQAKMRLYLHVFNHKFNTHNNAIFSLKHHTPHTCRQMYMDQKAETL